MRQFRNGGRFRGIQKNEDGDEGIVPGEALDGSERGTSKTRGGRSRRVKVEQTKGETWSEELDDHTIIGITPGISFGCAR